MFSTSSPHMTATLLKGYIQEALIFGGEITSFSDQSNLIHRYNGVSMSTEGVVMASIFSKLGAATMSNVAYVFGGNAYAGSGGSNKIGYYNFDGYWHQHASTLYAVVEPCQSVSKMNNIAYIFGYTNGSIDSFNGTSRSLVASRLLNPTVIDLSTAYCNSAIYAFGGLYNSSAYSTIQKFLTTAVTMESTNLATTNMWSSSISLTGAYANIFGGQTTAGAYQNTIQKWDGSIRTNESATLATAFTGGASCVIGTSHSYTFGGHTSASGNLNTIVKWDGTTRSNESATLTQTLAHSGAASVLTPSVYSFA